MSHSRQILRIFFLLQGVKNQIKFWKHLEIDHDPKGAVFEHPLNRQYLGAGLKFLSLLDMITTHLITPVHEVLLFCVLTDNSIKRATSLKVFWGKINYLLQGTQKLKVAHSVNYFPRFFGKNIKNFPPSKFILFTSMCDMHK